MKKLVSAIIVALASVCIMATSALAVSSTPSTNAANQANGWAYVTPSNVGPGHIDLTFHSTRNFLSCFEVRSDGNLAQSTGANYNPAVTDGLYPYYCVKNTTLTITATATAYVEVRMVFGAESDERFDWTRFGVLPVPPVPPVPAPIAPASTKTAMNTFVCYSHTTVNPSVYRIDVAFDLLFHNNYFLPSAVPGNIDYGTNLGAYHLVCNSTGKMTGNYLDGGGFTYDGAWAKSMAYDYGSVRGETLNVFAIKS